MSKPSTLQGKYSAAGEGNVYARANVATCKITASDTDGTFEIFDEQCKPGFESRLHMHTKSFQVCYVVDGSGEFQLGDEVFHAKKGACVNIPPGVPHKVGSKEGMRMLMVYSPPGLEGMMAAMKALSARTAGRWRADQQDSWPSTTRSSSAKAPAARVPARCWAETTICYRKRSALVVDRLPIAVRNGAAESSRQPRDDPECHDQVLLPRRGCHSRPAVCYRRPLHRRAPRS